MVLVWGWAFVFVLLPARASRWHTIVSTWTPKCGNFLHVEGGRSGSPRGSGGVPMSTRGTSPSNENRERSAGNTCNHNPSNVLFPAQKILTSTLTSTWTSTWHMFSCGVTRHTKSNDVASTMAAAAAPYGALPTMYHISYPKQPLLDMSTDK